MLLHPFNYIAIEGPDGSGTTTVSKALTAWLNTFEPLEVKWVSEPSDEPTGRLIRSILRREVSIAKESLLHLFIADRADLLVRIDSYLKEDPNRIVISDRSYVSSHVYQQEVHDIDYIKAMHNSPHLKRPPLTLILDVKLETALGRIQNRSSKPHEIYDDCESIKKQINRYHSIDRHLLPMAKGLVYHIDANRSLREVLLQCLWRISDLWTPGRRFENKRLLDIPDSFLSYITSAD